MMMMHHCVCILCLAIIIFQLFNLHSTSHANSSWCSFFMYTCDCNDKVWMNTLFVSGRVFYFSFGSLIYSFVVVLVRIVGMFIGYVNTQFFEWWGQRDHITCNFLWSNGSVWGLVGCIEVDKGNVAHCQGHLASSAFGGVTHYWPLHEQYSYPNSTFHNFRILEDEDMHANVGNMRRCIFFKAYLKHFMDFSYCII
jgi:hypothetical protein